MRNLSSEFKQAVKNGNRNFLKFADLKLKDGTIINLDNRDFWNNGFEFLDSVSGETEFLIGAVNINSLKLTINNIYDEFTNYIFDGASVTAYFAMKLTSGIERIKIGEFTVVEAPYQNSSIITLTCEDNMRKFDKEYSKSTLKYPATLGEIVRDACSVCGVILGTPNFSNYSYIVQKRPNSENLTFRQVLQWAAQIACCWCRCNENGHLTLDWYNIVKDDGISEYSKITEMTDVSINLDTIVITGIKVTETVADNVDSDTAKTYQIGTEGYILSIFENRFITEGTGGTVAAIIGDKIIGMDILPYSLSCLTDPSLEAGDIVHIIDRKGNTHMSYVTTMSFNPGNFQRISCDAISRERQSDQRYDPFTQIYTDTKNMVQSEKTERELAIEELANRISESDGVFTTVESTENGGKIYYLHNKPLLSDSDMVWKMTAEAWAVSTDGGKTWNAGMTVDGDTIVRILNATGINANWINAGKIEVKDSEKNTIFLIDKDTNQIIIDGSFITIGDRSLIDTINLSKSLSVTLTNEYQGISTDWQGNYSEFPVCKTIATVIYGSEDVSKQSNFSITKSSGVLGKWDSAARTYTITDLLADTGWVDIQATYLNNISLNKRFSVAKIKNGKPGSDGTSVKILGTKDSVDALPTIGNEVGDGWIVNGDLHVWNGTEWTNAGPIQGPAGKDGKTSYLHIKYSDDGGKTFSGGDGKTPAAYIGQYVDFIESDSTDVSDYTWAKFEGKGIKSSNVSYQKSDSGTVVPLGIWSKQIPRVEPGMFLWTRTQIEYDDETESTSYSVSKMGDSGKVYFLEYPTKVLKRSSDFSINPTRVRLNAYYREGNNSRQNYSGKFVIEGSSNGVTWEPAIYSSENIENTIVLYVGNICNVPYSESNKFTVSATKDHFNITSDYYAVLRAGINYTLTFESDGEVGSSGNTVELFLILNKTSSTIIRITSKKFTFTPKKTGKYYIRFEVNQNGMSYKFWDVNIQQIVNNTIPVPIKRDWIALRCSLYADTVAEENLLDIGTISILTDVSALSHEQIFNLLTNNGEIKGIYKEGNQLYISATYVKTGVLTVGGADNKNGLIKVLDSKGEEVATLSEDGINAQKGIFAGKIYAESGDITGNITVSGSISSWLTLGGESFQIKDGKLNFTKNLTNITSMGLLDDISDLSSSTHYLSLNVVPGGRGIAFCLNNKPYYTVNKKEYGISGHKQNHVFFGTSFFDNATIFNNNVTIKGIANINQVDKINFEYGGSLAANGIDISCSTNFNVDGNILCQSLTVTGSKNRAVNTKNFGTVGMNAFESAEALFSDFGSAIIGEDGTVDVYIDIIFAETVDLKHEYRVYFSQTSPEKIYYVEKFENFFRIHGEKKAKCDWMIVFKQRGYTADRTESLDSNIYKYQNMSDDFNFFEETDMIDMDVETIFEEIDVIDYSVKEYLEQYEKELVNNEY